MVNFGGGGGLITPRIERKLAAILAADVVGYSRLMGDDEPGTHARLKAHRKEFIEPLIGEHRGRVVKLTGDGMLVEFASAVDAVECAVALQNGMVEREAGEPEDRRLRLRMGINIGDIMLEEGDIYGDGVNIATRLEGLAEPGGICIARNVYNQVRNKLALPFEPMGQHRVKNIAEPVETFRVALDGATLSAPAKSRRRTPVAIAASIAALLALGGGGAWWWHAFGAAESAALPLPDQPSIAILPFDNLGGDPAEERFANGGSPRTSSPICRAFAICSSSPVTRPRFTKTSRSMSARSGAILVFATYSKAACNRLRSACASRPS